MMTSVTMRSGKRPCVIASKAASTRLNVSTT